MSGNPIPQPQRGGEPHPLDAIFGATSVALVGLSANPAHMSAATLRNLRSNGFSGTIYPVNPRRDVIAGLTCYPDIGSLPEAVDVAVIMVPADAVSDVIRQCGQRGIAAAVVLTAGFEESPGGAARAEALADAALAAGVTLIGPNCEGIWSVRDRVVLSFGSAAARNQLHHAPIAVISQSGAVAGAVARHLQDSGTGCAYVISAGNETCLDSLDLLDWVLDRDDVAVVLMFVEGLRNGARILALADRARQQGIRIVVLKSGNSAAGQLATSSHTGKIASPHKLYRDIFRQAGLIQVDRIDDLITAGRALLALPPLGPSSPSEGVAIFSIPGGTRALTVDLCEQHEVPVCRFAEDTIATLTAILPDYAQAHNPTDMTGEILSRPELFEQALAVILVDPGVTSVILQLANRGLADLRHHAELICASAETLRLPIIVSLLGDRIEPAEALALARRGVIVVSDPADAVRYLGWLYQAAPPPLAMAAGPMVRPPSSKGWADGATFLAEIDIPVVRTVAVVSDEELATQGAVLHAPFVVKALPEQVAHKTEFGLVRVGLPSLDAVAATAKMLRQRLGLQAAPILVQEMVSGVEAVLSVFTDKDFGPVLSIGTGGQAVELWQDTGFLALPAGADDVMRLLGRLKLGTLLAGFRGAPPADLPAFVRAAVALGDAHFQNWETVDCIELNPLFVRPAGEGVMAVDILIHRQC